MQQFKTGRNPNTTESNAAQGLHALYMTVQAMTELASVDQVLQSIVRHSHRLIGTDLVYLTVEENGQRSMRAVEGTFSNEFRTASLELNIGIAGLVSESLAPAWTENYLADKQFAHSERFDYLMSLEGIVSLLGVPLLDEGELRGVLFVGQRQSRRFTADEVAMLSTFANHASISLQNARLYQQSQDAVKELTRLQLVVGKTARSLQQANKVHDLITRSVLQNGSYKEVLALLVEAVPGQLELFDDGGRSVSRSSGPMLPTLPVDAVAPRVSSTATTRVMHSRLSDGQSVVVVDVLATNERLGYLVHVSDTPCETDDDYILERGAQILAMLMLRTQAVADAGFRARGEIITDIVRTRGVLQEDTLSRARSRGIDITAMTHTICLMFNAIETVGSALTVLNTLGYKRKQMAFGRYNNSVIGLSDEGSLISEDRLVKDLISAGFKDFTVAVEPFYLSNPVEPQISKIMRVAKIGKALRITEQPIDAAALAPYSLLFDIDYKANLSRFVRSQIGVLLDYDVYHKSALQATVATYFAQDMHAKKTSEALFIHINTLTKRFGRIDHLLGASWRTSPRNTMISLACQLLEINRHLHEQS